MAKKKAGEAAAAAGTEKTDSGAARPVRCEHCEREAVPDPDGKFRCARCKRERL